MTREEFAAKFPGMTYPFDENNGSDYKRRGYEKRVGRNLEVYQNRAPKVKGRLVDYDDRFGRLVIMTAEGEVELMLSAVIQVRWLPD